MTSPNTNIDDLDKILICNCGMNDILNDKHYDDCPKALKTQLEALLSAAKIEGELKGLNKIIATPSTYNWPGLDKRIKFLEKELESFEESQ
jgi:hypothetical protein